MTPAIPTGQDCARASNRALLVIACEVRQGTRPWQVVHLDDLSPTGFRIAGLSQPSTIKPLSIRIPGMQLLSAHVRWHRGNEVGCEFAAPLHVAVFEHLVRQANQALAIGR
ncbi:MAG: PilZ domain-containing protein [Sphingomonadales bacterium]|nr:PilZ domain-containing protein [Sphingomonadaceae bacterium]MBS3929881.1 PilZ domain-containing protein [Sphingomonadales bacterium]